jgi:hypothetical protein
LVNHAGVVFIAVHLLLRLNLPASPENTTGEWLLEKATSFDLALRLVPFGGLFLLWFIGVARDRLAEWEDKFFAKVFLSI